MWNYVKWTFRVLIVALVAAVLHYTLPQHDIARITDTYPKRVDFGENWWFYSHAGAGDAEAVGSRDVFFIATVLKNGKPMEYRNEDTAWSWPPYFKFNTANLQTKASDLKSSKTDPQWVVVRHYGWRSNLYSIYPNILDVRLVDDPDMRIIPWFNIVFLTLLFAVFWAIRVRWLRFRATRIDPVFDEVGDSFDAAGDAIAENRNRFRRWLDSWKAK